MGLASAHEKPHPHPTPPLEGEGNNFIGKQMSLAKVSVPIASQQCMPGRGGLGPTPRPYCLVGRRA